MAERTCTCSECGVQFSFTGKGKPRDVCYRQECIDARQAKWNAAKVARKSQLRAGGQWKAHVKETQGLGKGPVKFSEKVRKCLGCDTRFYVPEDTDYHLCPACRTRNECLLHECEEEAVGPIAGAGFGYYGTINPNNGGRRCPVMSGSE